MKKDKDMFTIGEAAEAIGITRRIILIMSRADSLSPTLRRALPVTGITR